MNEEMDENNFQAPVVVQVANREDQKLYKEDFDESESAKEYVIDQIFCGENLTIYALFEISDSISEKHFIEVTESSTNEEFKFYHRSSYKKSKETNGFKSNCKNFSSNDIDRLSSKGKSQTTESFYCLKNNGGQFGVDESRDLKVLFSKNELRFASKGVNTDIAQCPKLVDDIQKAISIGKPFRKGGGKTIEIQVFPPDKSSYELIEMETAPSESSCGSDTEEFNRDYRKSSPTVLLVPLLMLDGELLNVFKIKDKNQNHQEKKFPSSEKVSLGINTDFSCLEFLEQSTVSDRDQESNIEQTQTKNPNSPRGTVEKCKEFKSNEMKEETYEPDSDLDFTSKKNIIKEIKNLQDKLNNLIKSLEYSECKKFSGGKSPSVSNLAQQSSQPSVQRIDSRTDSKSVKRRYDDLPIFSPVTINTKPLSSKVRKKPSIAERGDPSESIPIHANSTVSILTSVSGIFESFESPWNENKGKENLVGELSKKQSHRRNVSSNNKILPVSKSECSLQLFRIFTPDSKCSFVVELRKTLSYELGEDKTDGLGAKKMKCASFKSEGNFKSKNNVRVHSNVDNVLPTNITPLHCEMGDEIGKKQKQDALVVEQKITENEGLLKVLEKDVSLPVLKKPSQKDEEGDAKISYETPFSVPSLTFPPKSEKVVENYCNANGDKTLKKEKSFKRITGQSRIKSGMSIDIETKVSGQMVKPTTPNKNDKKFNTEANARKDSKNSNLNKSKIPDKINRNVKKETPQPEPPKPRSLTCNRPKSSGQSKLRKAPTSANEIVFNKTHAKSEREEKLSGKYDQLHLPKATPHKRERREISQPQSDNKERETVSNQTETCDSIQNRTINPYYSHPTSQIKRDEPYFQKHDFEEKMVPKNKSQIPSSPSESSSVEGASVNPTSVVVELFSKKQSSIADSHTEFDQEFTTGPDTDTSLVGLDDKDLITDAEDTDGALETGVKSVWALTKVLLFGDGTKKFEVLEVSLTPPERSLNSEKLQGLKNG